MNENGTLVDYGNEPEHYVTDVLSDKAVQFIDKDNNHPFFMYINTVAPHVPSIPAQKYKNRFNDLPVTYAFESDLDDKPAWVRNYENQNRQLIKDYFGNTKTMERLYRDRWRTMLSGN